MKKRFFYIILFLTVLNTGTSFAVEQDVHSKEHKDAEDPLLVACKSGDDVNIKKLVAEKKPSKEHLNKCIEVVQGASGLRLLLEEVGYKSPEKS